MRAFYVLLTVVVLIGVWEGPIFALFMVALSVVALVVFSLVLVIWSAVLDWVSGP